MGEGIAVALITAISGIVGIFMTVQTQRGSHVYEETKFILDSLREEVSRQARTIVELKAEVSKTSLEFKRCKKLLRSNGFDFE